MEMQHYIRVLRARWRLVAVAFVLAVLGALGASLLTTPLYAASTQLFVSTTGTSDAAAAYQGNLFSQQRVTSYAQLITGQEVAQRVVDAQQLPITAAQLASEVSAKVVLNTVLLEVTVTDRSPAQARDLANAVSGQFTQLVTKLETPQGATVAPVRVSVVETAQLPVAPVVPNTTRNVALGGLIGLMLGLGLALLRDRLDNTVKDRAEAGEAAGAAVIGAVPFDADLPKRPLVPFGEGHSSSAEAYRQLRTNLQFLDVDNPPKTLVITSAVPGEGKTTTALNLAMVLAESGNRVALVEGDLRRPRITRYLQLIENVGITNVLAGSVDLDDVLQPTVSPRVTVLASGPHPPNPSELLGSSNMRALLDELRTRYDYVVIDAPPLLPVTDAAVLTTVADGAILVARHGHTKREQLSRAAANLRAIDATVLGTIIAMVPSKAGTDYEYAYYYESDRATVEPTEPKHRPESTSSARKPGAARKPSPGPNGANATTVSDDTVPYQWNPPITESDDPVNVNGAAKRRLNR